MLQTLTRQPAITVKASSLRGPAPAPGCAAAQPRRGLAVQSPPVPQSESRTHRRQLPHCTLRGAPGGCGLGGSSTCRRAQEGSRQSAVRGDTVRGREPGPLSGKGNPRTEGDAWTLSKGCGAVRRVRRAVHVLSIFGQLVRCARRARARRNIYEQSTVTCTGTGSNYYGDVPERAYQYGLYDGGLGSQNGGINGS
jgi:hypothetical protein